MEIPKPTEAEKEFFRAIVPDSPDVEVKPMFGNLGAFVNGNMFAGLFGAAVGVKLDDDARARLEKVEGVGPFGPSERPMGGYLALPASLDEAKAADWVARAHEHVATLPPKVKKAKK